MKLCD